MESPQRSWGSGTATGGRFEEYWTVDMVVPWATVMVPARASKVVGRPGILAFNGPLAPQEKL